MGIDTTIYGCIFGSATGPHSDDWMQQNCRRMKMLPLSDEYPELTANMFTKPAEEYGVPGLYHVQMIAFGASFKDMENSWDVWLRKFERLLSDLAWRSVELHVDFHRGAVEGATLFHYRWTRDKPTDDRWHFEGGPRELGEEAGRVRAWIPEAEEQLRQQPDDTDLLVRLIEAHRRMGSDDRAADLLARLRTVDPESRRN